MLVQLNKLDKLFVMMDVCLRRFCLNMSVVGDMFVLQSCARVRQVALGSVVSG